MNKKIKTILYILLSISILALSFALYIVKYGTISLVNGEKIEKIADSKLSNIKLIEIEENELINLTKTTNNKSTLFLFWASWCTTCKIEMNVLKELSKKHNFETVVISVDRNNKKQKELVKSVLYKYDIDNSYILNYETSFDINNMDRFNPFIKKLVNRDDASLPYTVFYNSEGKLAFIIPGFFSDSTIGYNVMDSVLSKNIDLQINK